MRRQSMLGAVRVAATYTGTIIGAGFASGQEMLQFFIAYGSIGLAGILLAGGLFAWLGSRMLELGYRFKLTGYPEALQHICGKKTGWILDFLTAGFLFGVMTVMLAGTGVIVENYFYVSAAAGILTVAAAVAATVWGGIENIANANMLVTPLLALSALIIGIHSLLYHGLNFSLLNIPVQEFIHPAPHWLLAALLYVSYNLVVSSTVLVPLGAQIRSHHIRKAGGILGGLSLGLLAGFIAVIIMLHYPLVLQYEVPMLYIASGQATWIHMLYAFTLLAAMYTTAVACLFGCSDKLHTATGLNRLLSILVMTGLALWCSQKGFSHLIALIFPLFGYATLWFTFRLVWLSLPGRKLH
ncbi:Hypothetical protein LUCI_5146 [Lucifera butyrica]|uniref:Membrane protein YkvI n=1 Tax=Lucifera butyrica TaxID=1351585 RepID=A0A498RLB2_9FIRM|nr:hypothetical protein [Lucifera butyrica]VBB09848.1 Hypothetical protein LUCI_5146 [Lucifera butyrica]